jgi:2-succinyl-5-enolpyruvyl-6-hydroxy-3-cyclohexene-1-carboxylate synthase
MFSLTSESKIGTFSNRGASGIDGVLSTGLGISTNYKNGNSVLLIGDISFLHDMGGLLSINNTDKISIVVVNNSGGGIFSFLPLSKSGLNHFEEFWTTKRNVDFKKIAELYQCKHYLINNLNELKEAIKDSFLMEGVKILEAKININTNVKAHERVLNEISKIIF